ncbi:DEAD/DEAH box helicase [Georgenia halophila]|uniref:DEAD/DEAH box helicase n=1 Tax=Georgenia halophila TaxID=620889 RepID=A0ABP8KZF0_9MICO
MLDPVELLRTTGARDGRLLHLEVLPARPGRTAEWPAWADPDLVAGYRRLGVDQPWAHQVSAADAAHAGRHTIIATGTGSGKSLAAWLPALSAVRAGRAGTAGGPSSGSIKAYDRRSSILYLSPTKALAADQLAGLERLLEAAELRDVRLTTCDGDTPLTERDWARDHADAVLSNPDFLHFSMLPGHRRWQRLLKGLRYVVVDECHAYRGVLGAHVALVLRRLLRLARSYGAAPTVLAASATTAEPALTAARLIGAEPEEITAVTADMAPAGRRTIVLWQPALSAGWPAEGVDLQAGDAQDEPFESGPRRSATAETSELLADLVSAGARTLAFVRSRYGAEVIAEQTRRHLRAVDPDLAGRVAAYRGGYLPEERRDLERSLRSGELLALATTNALELGVDVAGLDAVVMAGWPGTRVSMWQQAGRAGRAGADGVAVLVASEDPLDGYVVHHPETIFGVEATTFDPANPYVLAPHLCAAASELPLTEPDLTLFGLPDASLLEELERRGLLRRRPTGWFWNIARPERPQNLTDLRGGGESPVQIVEAETGTVLGTVDGARADATVHPGAVYIHQGRTFVVDALEDDVALVHEKSDLSYRTKARSESSVRILSVRDEVTWQSRPHGDEVTWRFGDVEVTSRVAGYDRRRLPGMEIVGSYPLDTPERVLATTATWWTVSEEACADAGVGKDSLPGALHAAEHASIGLLPLLATCDRWDIGGLSTAVHPQTGQPTVFVHDGYPGGAGFAERGYRAALEWIRATRDAIVSCGCADGCPACVQSPKCGNGNAPLDKAGAVRLLSLLLRCRGGEAAAEPVGETRA